MTIYIDSLFMTNLFMDFVIVFVMCVMRRKAIVPARLLLASAVSAFYGTLFFFPSLSFIYGAVFKIFFSFVPILISAKIKGIKDFFVSLSVFWFITGACAGIILAISTMSNFGIAVQTMVSNCIMYVNISPITLGIGCILLFVIAESWRRNCIKAFTADRLIIEIETVFMGHSFVFSGLIDTGCELVEPLSGAPVIVAEKGIFKSIPLPDAQIKVVTASGEGSLRMLLPDIIESKDKRYQISKDAVIAVTESRLSDYGIYQAIINPAAVDMCVELSNNTRLRGNKSEEIFC